MKIIELEQVNSTNEYCKRLKEDAIVVAARQTAGKGTKGRSFDSGEGGLYISLVRTYENFDFSDTFRIMVNACTAVCKTVEELGFAPVVRWANDVLIKGRKVSGTLIENTLLSGNICRSIVGIGLNVNNVLPKELKPLATTLCEQAGRSLKLDRVRDMLISKLENGYSIGDYKSYINYFNRPVMINEGGKIYEATALDVDVDGRLIVGVGGAAKKLSSGEVSLSLK